jgi:hypothetical protein
MKKTILCALALGLSFTTLHADTFGSGVNAFTIGFAAIGNPGNAGDPGVGAGAVSYVYSIGVTEVPADWITKATNLGLANVSAGPWIGQQPATELTWYEAAAFVNWLNTSTGHQAAYQLNGTNTALTLWSSAQAWQADGENLYRHKDAYYFLPSEDEWYKAAYHKNDGVTANYWEYPTGSDTIPVAVASGTAAGTAVFNGYASPAAVDENGGLSPYGTRGQGGNVYEWEESPFAMNYVPTERRVIRGGSYGAQGSDMRSFAVSVNDPATSYKFFGFRVASVPEPSCAMIMLSGSLLGLARRRRSTALCL